jgi:CHAT domain/FHA domain
MNERMTASARIAWRPNEGANGSTGTIIFPIGSIVTIGRHADNSIVLSEERVSRNHARLEVRNSEVILTDLNSTNGCSIDGRQRLGSAKWREGEELRIGTYILELRFISVAPVAVVRPLVEPQATPYSLKGEVPTRMERGGLPDRGPHPPAPVQAPASGSTLRRLEIVLNAGSITEVGAPAYVIGAFEHINPTSTKVASALDEKLGRVLATVAQRGAFDSRVGEISIISMPQQQRSLTALLVFAGMGAINMFAPAVLEIVGEKLAKALSSAKILDFATVPMGVGAGLSIKDFVVRFLTGFMRGLSATKDSEAVQKLTISEVDKDRTEQIRRELKALVDEGFFSKIGFQVVLSEARVGAPTAVHAPTATPVYLQVLRPSETSFEYCLLSPEHGAAIELHQHTIDLGEQARIAGITERLAEFDAKTGAMLTSAYVPVVLQDLLCRSLAKATTHLVVIHDQASSTIPWEAFYFKDRCPALDIGVSRLYRIASRGSTKGHPILPPDATLRMLVVEDPTGDLAGAQSEGDQLTQLFRANRGHVLTLKGADASRVNILSELGSGNYDLLHYAGHADFVETSPQQSGLILTDGKLTAADLLEVGKVPHMIFLNACESGRMRGPISANARATHFVGQVGLAEGFLLSGIANFIGTYWPVNDLAALRFAHTFYSHLLTGNSLSASMRAARQVAKTISPRDWANYLHFGDPLYMVRVAERSRLQ